MYIHVCLYLPKGISKDKQEIVYEMVICRNEGEEKVWVWDRNDILRIYLFRSF